MYINIIIHNIHAFYTIQYVNIYNNLYHTSILCTRHRTKCTPKSSPSQVSAQKKMSPLPMVDKRVGPPTKIFRICLSLLRRNKFVSCRFCHINHINRLSGCSFGCSIILVVIISVIIMHLLSANA